jgi:hypothetical protein
MHGALWQVAIILLSPAVTAWWQTRDGRLRATRLRAICAVALGSLFVLIGGLGLLLDGPSFAPMATTFIFVGLIYCNLAWYIRGKVGRLPESN